MNWGDKQSIGATVLGESDPAGLKPGEPGCKLDAGKVRMGLVLSGFANALIEVGKVGTHGAEKYSEEGWKSVSDPVKRYTDAMFRHFLDEMKGEKIDPNSGLLHAAHAAWNALARLEFIVNEEKEKKRKQ